MTTENLMEDYSRQSALLEKLEKQVCAISTESAANAENIRQTRGLLENLEGKVRVLGEAYDANARAITETRAELEKQIAAVDHRVMELDVRLNRKLDALDTKLDTKLDTLDTKLSGELSRIAKHLGLKGVPRSPKHRQRGTAKHRKVR